MISKPGKVMKIIKYLQSQCINPYPKSLSSKSHAYEKVMGPLPIIVDNVASWSQKIERYSTRDLWLTWKLKLVTLWAIISCDTNPAHRWQLHLLHFVLLQMMRIANNWFNIKVRVMVHLKAICPLKTMKASYFIRILCLFKSKLVI